MMRANCGSAWGSRRRQARGITPIVPVSSPVRAPGGLSRAARVLMRLRLFEAVKMTSSVPLVVGVALVVGPHPVSRDRVWRI